MMNQGARPTFEDGRRSLEAHLFDFEGDLYGEWVQIEWVRRLRDVRRFASVEQLRQQLERDRGLALDGTRGRAGSERRDPRLKKVESRCPFATGYSSSSRSSP